VLLSTALLFRFSNMFDAGAAFVVVTEKPSAMLNAAMANS
jgi:hypothetical protein